MTQTQDIWKEAVHNHRLGHLDTAEALYRQLLAHRPADPYAWHALGTIAVQRQQYAEALTCVTRAITANPTPAQFHNTRGVILEMLDRLDDAIAAYTRAMSLEPHYAEAQVNLAIVLQRQGHWEQALGQCQEVLQAHPNHVKAHHVQAYCHQQLGHPDRALAAYERVLRLDPGLAEAYTQMGVLLAEQQRHDQAIAAFQQALRQTPDSAEAHNNLAISLRARGHVHQAVTHYREAIRLDPTFFEAFYNLAHAQAELDTLEDALGNCEQAIRLNPLYAPAYNQLGMVLQQLGQTHQALEAYQTAVHIDPQLAEAYNNLGILCRAQGDFSGARQYYQQALALEPACPETLYNLGNTLKEMGHCQEAIRLYAQAIELRPDYADAHWNLSLACLLQGDMARGWAEYTWRTRVKLPTPLYQHHYERPSWTGASFPGKRLLVYSEQGLGDTIQFARYLPQVKALGGQVWVETWAPLQRLLESLGCVDRVLETSTEKIPDTDFDLCVSIMDLPRIFQTTLTSIPSQVPYFTIQRPDTGTEDLPCPGDQLNVGIVWAGAPTHGNDSNRSCGLHCFTSLARIPGVQLYALQKGQACAQLDQHPDLSIPNLVLDCQDLMDTACLLERLDLIITVDTALAHLAGALGRPTWTLLPFAPDWRWLLERADSPWYPTMRLFRQDAPGHWQGVFERVQRALHRLRVVSAPDDQRQLIHAGGSA